MKILKVLGVTCFVSGLAVLGARLYNESRMEKLNSEFFEEQMHKSHQKTVLEHRPMKYDSLLNEKAGKFDWAMEAASIRDSINSKAQKAYFDGGKLAKDTLKVVKKIIK